MEGKTLSDLTQDELKKWMRYDPETGVFIRTVKRGGHPAGEVAGTAHPDGYWQIKINGKFYLAHRLAWLYMTGGWPLFIDHKDLDKRNNRWTNLRNCTKSQNTCNSGVRSDNTSGIKGVNWSKEHNAWAARVQINGLRIHLGYFDDLELAELVVKEARESNHKDFCRHL